MAHIVGATGLVYSTDINPDRLTDMRHAVEAAGLRNVTIVAGAASATNLPEQCCDSLFMRHVYHHFANPVTMNRSLHATVKPGGRIAIVDFEPDSGRSAAPEQRASSSSHGVMPQTVIDELTASGFVEAREVPWPSAGYFAVVAKRPVISSRYRHL